MLAESMRASTATIERGDVQSANRELEHVVRLEPRNVAHFITWPSRVASFRRWSFANFTRSPGIRRACISHLSALKPPIAFGLVQKLCRPRIADQKPTKKLLTICRQE